ncbi:hypothetical protein HN873_052196, partial [Arachis hypogaea]
MLLWFGDLNDLRILPDAGQDLYIRVPASKLVWVTIGVLCVPPPKKETLSRHSFLGPSCLRGQWLGPSAEIKESDYKQMLNIEVNIVIVPYTFLAVHVDSLNQAGQYDLVAIKELDQGPAASTMNSVLSLDDGRWWHPAVESCSPVPLPPLVLAQVYPESSPIPPSKVADPRPGPAKSSQDSGPGPTCENDGRFFETGFQKHTKKLRDMWCSCRLPENMVFHITTLIIPKQESTSDSLSNVCLILFLVQCSTLNEEEIFEVQDILSLFPLGWIHVSSIILDRHLFILSSDVSEERKLADDNV